MTDKNKSADFTSLTENLSQQQAKISALKELVRQSESQQGKNTASAQEKVKNIAQRLSNLKSKASRNKQQQHHRASSEVNEDITHFEEDEDDNVSTTSSSFRAKSETPGNEKMTLLRKQMELNRLKMAERESKSKEIEQMVTQLKSKFESSQMSLEKSVELGRSMGDLSSVPSMLHSQHRSVTDISRSSHPINLENERIKFLEKRIHDLENELSTKTVNLSGTDAVVQLERRILDLEESIKEKDCIIEARTKAVSLLSEDLSKKKKDVVDSLEDTKQEMFKMQEAFLDAELAYKREVAKLNRAILDKSDEIKNLNEKCEILEKSRYDLTIENSELKSKLEDVQDYSTKISELNKLNETLQKRISKLEGSGGYEFITEEEAGEARKDEELENKIRELEAKLAAKDEHSKPLQEMLAAKITELEQLEESLQEKTVEVNVVNANMQVLQEKYNALISKPTYAGTAAGNEESQEEIAKLKQQLDDANKSAIKTKLQIKKMQKQIDAKPSDGNQEITRLNSEIQSLTQKIAELEEEKGSYQLQQLSSKSETELEQKLRVLEETCQSQLSTIQLLEDQKSEVSEKFADALQALDRLKDNSELGKRLSEVEGLNREHEEKVSRLLAEKEEINSKMNQYLNENMELLDKLEKLSKGSSAESIEIMAQLTAQEMQEYQKEIVHKDEELPAEISQELNESLKSLRMESSELMDKIELFTVERREVLEKLDALTLENQVLTGNLENVKEEKSELENQVESLKSQINEFEKTLDTLKSEKQEMTTKMGELSDHRSKLQEEINKLVREELGASSPHGSPLKSLPDPSQSSTHPFDRDACEKLLKQLDSEIQNLNKNKDKNQKLKISKKLSDNAKNVHAMMTNLLIEFYKNLDECRQLRDDLEKVKVLLTNVSGDKNNEEMKNLEIKLNESVEKLANKSIECEKLEESLREIQSSNEESVGAEMQALKTQIEILSEESNEKDDLIKKMQENLENLTQERDHCESEVQKQMALVSDLRGEFDQLCNDVKVNNQRLNEKSIELDQLQHEFDMRLKTSTSEVEILKTLVAEQKQLLIDAYQEHELDINQKIKEIEDCQGEIKQLKDELEALRSQNVSNQEQYSSDLRTEINKMRELLAESNREIENQKEELMHKQETIDTLNTQIIDLYKSMEENSNKLIEKEDELQYLQEITDSNKDEVRKAYEKISLADKTISELRSQLNGKNHEIEMLQQKPSTAAHDPKLDERIRQLENENKALEAKVKEHLDKLKKYAANLKKKQAQCSELEEKLTATPTAELNELRSKVIQYEEQLNTVKIENSKLAQESVQKSSAADEIEDLKWKIDEYEGMVEEKSKRVSDLEKQLASVTSQCDQIEEGSYEIQNQLQKLEGEKAKLEERVRSMETLENELKLAREELAASKHQEADIKEKSDDKKKMEKLKAAAVQFKNKLTEKKKEVEDLQAEISVLKSHSSQSSTLEVEEKLLSEISQLKQQLSELESSNRQLIEDKQRKVSLEGQLETFEMTNIELREKVARLEESVADFEIEKNALLREKLSLEQELDEKVNEVTSNDEIYMRHVNDLIAQDELIGKKLRETEAENLQLNETIKELEMERNSMVNKLTSLEAQAANLSDQSGQQIINLQNDNAGLQTQVEQLRDDMKNLKALNEQSLAKKHAEIDEMEAELSAQLQRIEGEKKTIQEALEKASDQIVDFQDEVVRLKDNNHSLEQARADLENEMSWLKLQSENFTQDQLEIEQLRMQLMQSETESENLRTQNETMVSNHEAEVIILRQQISDLEAMRSQVSQNQTDDQVMLQNENVKLKELLIEKESMIQQKVMQLQLFDAPIQAVSDPFANLAAAPPSSQQPEVPSDNLEAKLQQAHDEIERMRETQMMTNMELDMQSAKIQEILAENQKLQDKVREMQSIMDNLIKTNCELESAGEFQKDEIMRKEREVGEIKSEMEALRTHSQTQSTDDDKLHPLQSELAEKNRAIENLQNILQRYEQQEAPPAPQQQSQPFGTSMFFSDSQPSASSLFDDPFGTVQMQPVVEEEIKPKSAYLCGTQTEEQWLVEQQELRNQISFLQNQLQMMEQRFMEQSMELESQRQQICDLEAFKKHHEHPKPAPEKDEVIVPKKAYLCQVDEHQDYQLQIEVLKKQIQELESKQMEVQEEQNVVEPQFILKYFNDAEIERVNARTQEGADNPMAALEIEDGWGWSAESAALEATTQHQQQTSLLSPRSDLEVRLQEQKDLVERLETEKNSLNDELINIRENSKKMMKKLKEYQQKIKEMETRRSSSIESDMDLVIQEELNSQIQKLETRLKEINTEREKEEKEKESLSKKVEVLSNANERMLEMKERQDSQMELYQLKIRDLNQKLQNLEAWGEEDGSASKENVLMSPSKENQVELQNKVKELTDQIKDMQVDYDELQALLDEEKNNNKLLEEKLAKSSLSSDDEIEQLRQQLMAGNSQCDFLNQQLQSKNAEVNELLTKIDQFSRESGNIRTILEDLRTQVQQKTNENQQLNDRLQKLEVNNDEYSHNFNHQMQEMETQIQTLQADIQYKDAQFNHLNEKNQELSALPELIAARDQEILSLKSQLSSLEKLPTPPVDDLAEKVAELTQEKQQMEHELQVLNDQVLASLEFEDRMKNSVLELDAKNIEIQMLKNTIEQVQSGTSDVNGAEIEQLRREKEEMERNVDLINAQWSQMVEQRGNEVASSWKQHLEMREAEFAEIESNLQRQLEEVRAVSGSVDASTEDDDTKMKMKLIMESQEVEIVSLKEQLAIRSAEYAALSAKVDPYHQMSTSMNVSPIPQTESDKVPRSELDLALYMLHQREMRLEEMTLELVQLLEERDTLQLRLSNAIRQIEEIKKKFNIEADSSDQSTPEKLPPMPSTSDVQLKAKLSELNTIRHGRDKGIAEDREKRFMENISLFQRDVANIPSEAAARIVSNTDPQQSPSSVLMNWILGSNQDSSSS